MKLLSLLLPAVLAGAAGPSFAQDAASAFRLPEGAASLRFSGWGGPALTVETYRPENLSANAPIVFVMHGVNRNADDYRDAWIDIADACGLAIVAPAFDRAHFPRAAGYNLGEPLRENGGASAFDAIEPIFAAVHNALDSTQDGYSIFGHSAGAQFVHRFLMLTPQTRVDRAVVANPGWYTWPERDIAWPYGLADAPRTPLEPGTIAALPITLLLGEADNDPRADHLRQTVEARRQGRSRFTRGIRTAALVDRMAVEAGLDMGWALSTVPGVDHDNARMAPAAVRHLVPERIYNAPACRQATNGD